MRLRRPHILFGLLLGIICALALSSCADPLDVGEEKTIFNRNDKQILNDPVFVNAPGDSISATINNSRVIFATQVVRPDYYNSYKEDAGYYISIQASSNGLGSAYETISLRLDGIRDTGVYKINGPFTLPKYIDTNLTPVYGAVYDRKTENGYPESFKVRLIDGEIHILKIDHERGLIIGTFRFTAYDEVRGTEIKIDGGEFRIYVK